LVQSSEFERFHTLNMRFKPGPQRHFELKKSKPLMS